LPPDLQCKRQPDKVAKGTTQEEFEDNMVLISHLAHQHWPNKKQKPLFCYDNAKIQDLASYSSMGIQWHQRIKIPPHSPDFNKPIEHVFHQIKDKLREKLYGCTEVVTAEKVQEWILEIWNDHTHGIRTASVAKDVKSLKKTYLAIKTRKDVEVRHDDGSLVLGSGGDYPAADLR
jgi:beta-xylosidase